jgi:hypothetical protein
MNFNYSGSTPIPRPLYPSTSAACCRDESASYCLRGSPAEPIHDASLGPVSPLHESHDNQPRYYMNHKRVSRHRSHPTTTLDQFIAADMTLPGLLHDLSASASCCLRGSPAEPNHETSLGPVLPLHEFHDSQQAHQ